MRKHMYALPLLIVGAAQADVANGSFETGDFTGWTTTGPSFVGQTITSNPPIAPTDGNFQAWISTIGLPPVTPFADNDLGSPTNLESFLLLTSGTLDGLTPPVGGSDAHSGAAMKTTFGAADFGSAGLVVTFDWNFVTDEDAGGTRKDFAFVSVVGTGGQLAFKLANSDTVGMTAIDNLPAGSSGFGFSDSDNDGDRDGRQTGYSPFSIFIPRPVGPIGTYTLGFGVVDVANGNIHSVLVVDNVAATAVPEPMTMALMLFGLCGVVVRRRA